MERTRVVCRYVLLFILLVWAGFLPTRVLGNDQIYPVTSFTDISYMDDPEDTARMLDIYQATGRENAPVFFFVRGTGWTEGGSTERSDYWAFASTLAGFYGITTVVIDYRLSPEVIFPAHMEDVASAFAWVHDHIQAYDGDPDNIFVAGHSTGAHLAALLASDLSYLGAEGLDASAVSAVVAISGTYNLTVLGPLWDNTLETAFGTLDPETLADASPFSHVYHGMRPFLVTQAEHELPGFHAQADGFVLRMHLMRNDVTAAVLLGEGHNSEIARVTPDSPDTITARVISSYVESHLRP